MKNKKEEKEMKKICATMIIAIVLGAITIPTVESIAIDKVEKIEANDTEAKNQGVRIFYGYVKDLKTNEGISDATVTCWCKGIHWKYPLKIIESTVTDNKGYYKIETGFERASIDTWLFTAKSFGYRDNTVEYTWSAMRAFHGPINISMEQKENIHFKNYLLQIFQRFIKL